MARGRQVSLCILAAVCVVVLLLATVASATEHAQQPPPPTLARRTVVIGDIHGDVAQFRRALRMAKLIDGNDTWIADDRTYLVQMGDLVDRGPDDREVLDLAMRLRAAAPEGHVVFLLGNHEVMNMAGHIHYVHESSLEAFGGRHAHRRHVSATGEYGQFMRTFPAVHIAADTVFVHAGLQPKYAKLGAAEINRLVASAISSEDWSNAVLESPDGPLWTRKLISDAGVGRCAGVADALQALGAKRMIVGHTPQRDGRVTEFCEGQLIGVDVGLSKWMYSGMAALEINDYADSAAHPQEVSELAEVAEAAATDTAAKEEPKTVEEAIHTDRTALQELMDLAREAMRGGDEL